MAREIFNQIECAFMGFIIGALSGIAWYDSLPETPGPLPTPTLTGIASPRAVQELEREANDLMDTTGARCVTNLPNVKTNNLDAAWKMVYFVESSNGKHPNTYKHWHKSDPLGIAQVTPIVVEDVNRILGKQAYSLNDRLDDEKSREMFDITCKNYYPNGTTEQYCRLWHRGSNKKNQYDSKGDVYWASCKKVK